MYKRVGNRITISHYDNGVGKEGQPAFPLKGNRCALRPFRENRNYTAISPLGKGMRRVTSASRERRLRTSERKSRTRKNCNAVCAAASEYRNAAFSSHEDKDRAGPKRELLHCAVRFRVEQHRPPPSESFTTASSPILMAAAIVGPTTRFASTGTISFRIVPRNNDNSMKHHHSAMFSAANDTLLQVRSRRGQSAGGASGTRAASSTVRRGRGGRARGAARQREHLARRWGDNSKLRVGEPAKQPRHPTQGGSSARTASRPAREARTASAARIASHPAPPEKDQSAQTKHLGMARFARCV